MYAQTPSSLPTDSSKPLESQQSTPNPLRARSTGNSVQTRTPGQAAPTVVGPKITMLNGRPYVRPSTKDIFHAYLRDSYGLPALGGTTVRALYSEGRDAPKEWGTDFPGFMQRFGANAGSVMVTGNVRYAMESVFHEDLRYLPCHRCHVMAKIENALLAEITARHDDDGRRFFTLTPTIADFTGPIIAHSIWYPGSPNPGAGAVSARLAFATRVGSHLFQEFVLERHRSKPRPDNKEQE